MTTPPFPDIAPWPPTRHTPPLAEDFPSAFDSYADLFQHVWQRAFGYTLEAWQVQLIRAVLEIYPPGHPQAGRLRWRQAIISLGRQNGKTEIAAALGLWGLLMRAAPTVVGIASNADQARLVYRRTMEAIKGTPQLAARFKALTETRGIKTNDGGAYEIKAAKSAALQGIPVDVGLVDELHLLVRALWFDLVSGTGGRPNCIVVGITTAGDEDSELLLHLYELADAAMSDGDAARIGAWIWEAPEAARPDDDDTLGRYLALANPSVASGRQDLATWIEDVRSLPEPDAIRYRLNRFVKRTNTFIDVDSWNRLVTTDPFPTGVPFVISIDRTPDWGYATVATFAKTPDGLTYADVAASIVRPSLSQLADICTQLNAHYPATFAVDRYTLGDLGKELEQRGLPVTYSTHADTLNGSALFYAKIIRGQIVHPGHELLSRQIPRTIRKNVNEGFRISRSGSAEIDAVMSHVIGVYAAETLRDPGLPIA